MSSVAAAAGHCQVLWVIVHVIAQVALAACLQLKVVAPGAASGGGAGPQLCRRDLDSGFGQQSRGKIGVEGAGHGEYWQVLGGDSTMLSRHVRVQRVAGLGDRAAKNASVPRADGVLVLQVSAQCVGRPVDLAALGAGSGIGGSDADLQGSSGNCNEIEKEGNPWEMKRRVLAKNFILILSASVLSLLFLWFFIKLCGSDPDGSVLCTPI